MLHSIRCIIYTYTYIYIYIYIYKYTIIYSPASEGGKRVKEAKPATDAKQDTLRQRSTVGADVVQLARSSCTYYDTIRNVMLLRYKAEVEDAKYKIKCYSDHELVIPEHPDITAEIDKLLSTIAEAEDKMAVIKLHYGENKTEKTLL